MKFVSYARNHEDVVLWRALKNVRHGFYVDLESDDPDIDSVTKALYERGWCGINTQANPSRHRDFVFARSRDINLHCAVGDVSGEIEISENAADELQRHGSEARPYKVQVVTLAKLRTLHAPRDVHVLIVDANSLERSVMAGADFNSFRPWIILLETGNPKSVCKSLDTWEPVLLEAGYRYCLFDGRHHFLVAQEHPDLMVSVSSPACIYDNFIDTEHRQLETRLQHSFSAERQAHERTALEKARAAQAMAELKRIQQQCQEISAQLVHYQALANTANIRLTEIQSSKAWRLTAPLRATGSVLKRAVKSTLRPVLLKCVAIVHDRPALKAQASRLGTLFPGLAHRLRVMAIHRGLVEKPSSAVESRAASTSQTLPEKSSLSTHAERILLDLQRSGGRPVGHKR